MADLGDLELDLAIVELALAQHAAQLLARALSRRFGVARLVDARQCGRRQEQVEDPFLRQLVAPGAATLACSSSRTMVMASSVRSRIIDSTSRPT